MGKERKHVVFVGAYGIQNAGDDAPLLVLTAGLRRLHPEVDFTFTVFSRHPDPLLERAGGARFLPNVEYESRAAAGGKWFRGFNVGDDRTDLEAIEAAIRDADLVVAGAGNVLVDIALDLFRGPIALLATYAFLADLFRTPFFLFGVTAGPLQTRHGRDLSAWIARRASAVTVRDQASAALLKRLDADLAVDVFPDPVLGLVPASDAALERALAEEGLPPRGARPRLAVALRDLDFLGFDDGLLVETLRRLSAEYELLFVPQCT
ncbi:MAG: polysaccharide pyruvyl transferase family protein, partial [Deltaproteobacteria bacterium]|nr:polysaccharide pyruvyl transferase family protein [Deltaproteobacteria bacterium]